MGKDAKIKNKCNFEGYEKIKIKHDFYKPDCVFENGKDVIIVESSSTGDRKVHIGEMVQFIEYASSMKDKCFYFVLFLCGTSKTSPKANTVKGRLEYYYSSCAINKNDNIKGIYVVEQKEVDITKLSISSLYTWKINI